MQEINKELATDKMLKLSQLMHILLLLDMVALLSVTAQAMHMARLKLGLQQYRRITSSKGIAHHTYRISQYLVKGNRLDTCKEDNSTLLALDNHLLRSELAAHFRQVGQTLIM